MRTVLTADRLYTDNSLLDQPLILIEDGLIASISTLSSSELPAHDQHIHFDDATLAPSFFDVHIHGGAGHDVMEATPEALRAVGRFLATRGTASYLATTVTAPLDATFRSLEALAKLIDQTPGEGEARPLGIHLEGPFLSHTKRGVHPPAHLLEPDIALFDRMMEAAAGKICLLTLAPELNGAAEFARHASARGCRISLGHSNATAAETRAVIAAGAISATHTFNAMRALDHREPGILGTVLTTDSMYAEIICDGVHTEPELVRLWSRAKGKRRGLLVTDAMSATGMPDGQYMLGGFAVDVANGRAMSGGVLAGSVLTQDRALSNYMRFTASALADALPMLTGNPATMTGLTSETGSLAPGMEANLVALASDGDLLASIVRGQQVAR